MDVERENTVALTFFRTSDEYAIDNGIYTVCHSLHPDIIGSGKSPDSGAKAMLDLINKLAEAVVHLEPAALLAPINKLAEALTRLQAETQGGQ